MKSSFYVVFMVTGILNCAMAQPKKGAYELNGTLSGFPDGTVIYLDALPESSGKETDSTLLKNNKFQFTGSMSEASAKVVLKAVDLQNYVFLWLENSKMTVTAEKDKFKQAKITGSKAQALDEELDAMIATAGKSNEKEQSFVFIEKHPNSIISASILSTYAATWGKDTAALLYDKLSPEMKQTPYGKDIHEFITLNKKVKVGDQYVDFIQTNTNGDSLRLSGVVKKFTLLEFWGSWCAPCRQENPKLVKIYSDFKDKGFEILGVASDNSKEAWTNAVSKDGLPWPNVCDLNGDKNKAAIMYGISYYPTNFLIDQTGKIIAKDLRGDKLRTKLEELLN